MARRSCALWLLAFLACAAAQEATLRSAHGAWGAGRRSGRPIILLCCMGMDAAAWGYRGPAQGPPQRPPTHKHTKPHAPSRLSRSCGPGHCRRDCELHWWRSCRHLRRPRPSQRDHGSNQQRRRHCRGPAVRIRKPGAQHCAACWPRAQLVLVPSNCPPRFCCEPTTTAALT